MWRFSTGSLATSSGTLRESEDSKMKREVGEMERSNLIQPGAGHPVGGGIVLKVGADDSDPMSVFELTVAPGFDVGAHIHTAIEETFYVLEGSLTLQVGVETGTATGPGRSRSVP